MRAMLRGRSRYAPSEVELSDPDVPGPAIAVVDIDKRFGGTQALTGVTMSVPSGVVSGLIGPNGSGKTTLLRCITGFLAPDRGTVSLGGNQVRPGRPEDLAQRGIAQTFQRMALADDMTVAENVILALDARRVRYPTRFPLDVLGSDPGLKGVDLDAVVDALSLMGLEGWADTLVGRLPVGLRRRAELARAMVGNPWLLLLDEPTSGLDSGESAEVVKLIKDLNHRTGMTVLIVEHDMTVIAGTCEHLIVLEFGKILTQGSAGHVLKDPRVREAYLGRMVKEPA